MAYHIRVLAAALTNHEQISTALDAVAKQSGAPVVGVAMNEEERHTAWPASSPPPPPARDDVPAAVAPEAPAPIGMGEMGGMGQKHALGKYNKWAVHQTKLEVGRLIN